MAQIIDGKYIIELDELTSIELVDWLAFQPNTVPDQAYRISLTNFIKALPIIPAVAAEYDDIAELLLNQPGQTVDVFYKVADPSDDPDYNDLKDSEIKSVYYHLVDAKTGILGNYNSIAIPKLESSKFPKLGNSLEALTFDVKFRSAEWSSNKATLQAIANALKLSSPQDLLLDALSLKINTDNNPADISRVLFGLDGQLIFEPINSSKIQSDSDAGDVTLNDSYQLLLTITGDQNVANGLANIGITAKSFSTAAITEFQPSGNNRVRATSAAHGLSEGDYVEIVNTANYNDIVEIKAVPNINEFDFTHSDDGDETGNWEKSEDREIAVDLRIDAISVKEFTRQIEGEGRLNFSEQLSGLVNGEDITVYVKSNTIGEAIEILGTTQSSELKVISSDRTEPNTWYINTNGDNGNVGSSEFPFETIQAAHDAASEFDVIIIQSPDTFTQPSTPATTITKRGLIIRSDAEYWESQPKLQGAWTIDVADILLANVSPSSLTFKKGASVANPIIRMNNCGVNFDTESTRDLVFTMHTCQMYNDNPINVRSMNIYNSEFDADINAGRSVNIFESHNWGGDIVAGIDSSSTLFVINSFLESNVTLTGNLRKYNSVIIGTETVSGITTSRQAKVFDDPVLFKGQATANTTASDVIKATTSTPEFDFSKGNDHQMDVESNISSFTTINEKGSAAYNVYLINDAGTRTVVAPTGWTTDPTSETHTTAANAINRYQFYTLPDGSKYFNNHIVKS